MKSTRTHVSTGYVLLYVTDAEWCTDRSLLQRIWFRIQTLWAIEFYELFVYFAVKIRCTIMYNNILFYVPVLLLNPIIYIYHNTCVRVPTYYYISLVYFCTSFSKSIIIYIEPFTMSIRIIYYGEIKCHHIVILIDNIWCTKVWQFDENN